MPGFDVSYTEMTKTWTPDVSAKARVNCVCPGKVETPFLTARVAEYADPQKAYRDLSASHPLGCMARPQEVAVSVVYFASDDSAFITGSALLIDGEMSAGNRGTLTWFPPA